MYPTPYCEKGHVPNIYGQNIISPILAQAYVPFQYLTCIYTPMEGLDKGTIFPELWRPYEKKDDMKKTCKKESVEV